MQVIGTALHALVDAGVRVHIHTDNAVFSGSEETWCVLHNAYRDAGGVISASWRSSPDFDAEVYSRIPNHGELFPLSLPRERALTRQPLGWRRAAGPVLALLEAQRPDLLHINNGGWPGATSCLAAVDGGNERRRTVMVVNNLAYDYSGPRRLLRAQELSVARSVDTFVTGSQATARRLANVLGPAAHRIESIPNAISEQPRLQTRDEARLELGIPPNVTVLACVARLEARKGHHILLEAWRRLDLASHPILLVAGDGPEVRAIASLASDVNAAGGDVRILGKVNPWPLYAVADAVVLPSVDHEDMPLVILEAMYAGRPVVATDVAGSAALVRDGETGFVVRPNDAEDLASALTRIIAGTFDHVVMGRRAREVYLADYGSNRTIKEYAEVWQSTITERVDVAR